MGVVTGPRAEPLRDVKGDVTDRKPNRFEVPWAR